VSSAVKKEKLWVEEEMELQAAMTCHPDDPADMSGQRLLDARSFNAVQPMDDDTAALWSALESGNFVNMADDEDDEQDSSSDGGY
jgi:hypothetical protein